MIKYYQISISLPLTLILCFYASTINAQHSVQIPTDMSDLRFTKSSVMDLFEFHQKTFKRFTEEQKKFNVNLVKLANYMNSIRPGSPEYFVAAEAYESEWSSAMVSQFDYVNGLIHLREKMIQFIYNERSQANLNQQNIEFISKGIKEIEDILSNHHSMILNLAVLEVYGQLSEYLLHHVRSQADHIYLHEIPNTQIEKQRLLELKNQQYNTRSYHENNWRDLEYLELEIRKLTSGAMAQRSRIQTLARMFKEHAEYRLNQSDLWITNRYFSDMNAILEQSGQNVTNLNVDILFKNEIMERESIKTDYTRTNRPNPDRILGIRQ